MMGPLGATLIAVGSVVSMTGNNMGQILTGSRMLFALAEHGELPRFLSRVHPQYRTPSNAIWFTTAVALALALTGSFVVLAVVSAVARLVTYAGVAGATLQLRRAKHATLVQPPTYRTPFGPVVPCVALLVSLAILAGASQKQLLGGLLALLAGGALFVLRGIGNADRVARHDGIN
jgi:amino acid transporter